MLEFIIFVLGLSLLLYTLLGGADFGAGIVETFSGRRGINTISKAIAPIWEVNHIWLILAVVIVFNGFPKVYATFSIHLHIPLLIVLTGIILRGTAFTFRYYDVIKDNTGKIYTRFFRVSSILTSFFLGVCLGALFLGKIPSSPVSVSFAELYIYPWLNSFCMAMGLFTLLIFGTLAGVYLIGETKNDSEKKSFISISVYLFILLVLSGGLIFLTAYYHHMPLLKNYLDSTLSMICVGVSALSIPFTFNAIRKGKVLQSRILVGMQITLVFGGFVSSNFPDMIVFNDHTSLTFYNASATKATLQQLTYALIAGILIIIPSILYLFRVFKFNPGQQM